MNKEGLFEIRVNKRLFLGLLLMVLVVGMLFLISGEECNVRKKIQAPEKIPECKPPITNCEQYGGCKSSCGSGEFNIGKSDCKSGTCCASKKLDDSKHNLNAIILDSSGTDSLTKKKNILKDMQKELGDDYNTFHFIVNLKEKRGITEQLKSIAEYLEENLDKDVEKMNVISHGKKDGSLFGGGIYIDDFLSVFKPITSYTSDVFCLSCSIGSSEERCSVGGSCNELTVFRTKVIYFDEFDKWIGESQVFLNKVELYDPEQMNTKNINLDVRETQTSPIKKEFNTNLIVDFQDWYDAGEKEYKDGKNPRFQDSAISIIEHLFLKDLIVPTKESVDRIDKTLNYLESKTNIIESGGKSIDYLDLAKIYEKMAKIDNLILGGNQLSIDDVRRTRIISWYKKAAENHLKSSSHFNKYNSRAAKTRAAKNYALAGDSYNLIHDCSSSSQDNCKSAGELYKKAGNLYKENAVNQLSDDKFLFNSDDYVSVAWSLEKAAEMYSKVDGEKNEAKKLYLMAAVAYEKTADMKEKEYTAYKFSKNDERGAKSSMAENYEKAADIYSKLYKSEGMIPSENYKIKDTYEKASNLYEELGHMFKNNDAIYSAEMFRNAGDALFELYGWDENEPLIKNKDYLRAIALYKNSIDLSVKSGDAFKESGKYKSLEVKQYLNAAVLFEKIKQYEKAVEYYQRVKDILADLGRHDLANEVLEKIDKIKNNNLKSMNIPSDIENNLICPNN